MYQDCWRVVMHIPHWSRGPGRDGSSHGVYLAALWGGDSVLHPQWGLSPVWNSKWGTRRCVCAHVKGLRSPTWLPTPTPRAPQAVSEHSQSLPPPPHPPHRVPVRRHRWLSGSLLPSAPGPVGPALGEPGEEATRLCGSTPTLLCLDFTSVRWESGARSGRLVRQKSWL